jgi:N-acyl-L-homoserine lactone synthetase
MFWCRIFAHAPAQEEGWEHAMVFIANTENRCLFGPDLEEMHRHRKVVFVDRAGWQIPVLADRETDAYDRTDTMYLLAKDTPDGGLQASVRLLTTTAPHLMSDLFAAACRGGVPRGPNIWEVSRFCTAPMIQGRARRLKLLWEMICAVMETALVYGIDRVVFVANRALLPLAIGCGWDARALGATLRDAGDEITAVVAAITPEGLRRVRERYSVPAPVIRFPVRPAGEPQRPYLHD